MERRAEMKEPYVYANLQLYYKDYPKEYLGATGEYWTMGKRKPEKLSVLLADLIRTTVVFYLNCKGNVSPGEINEELDKVIDLIKLTKIEEKK